MPRIATQPQLAPIGSNLSATKRPTDRNASNNATHAGAANSDRFERVTSSSRAGNLDNIGGRFNTIAAGAGSRLDSLTAGLAAPTPGAGASMNVSRGADRHNNLPTTDRAPGRDATASHSIHVDSNVASSDYGLWDAAKDCFGGAREGLSYGAAIGTAIGFATGGITSGGTISGGAVAGAVIGCPVGIIAGVIERDEEGQPQASECVEPEATTSTDDEVSADENVSTPMPDAGAGVGSNTLSAEELRALKERLRAEATASLTQPSGEASHAGAPQVGTYNPMERQELNHLILNTDAVASEGDFELPFVNEEPEEVDPMDATTQPPSVGGDDTE